MGRHGEEIAGDPGRPGLDLGPVTEIAFGEALACSRHVRDEPLGEPDRLPITLVDAEEDPVIPGPHGLPKLRDLLRDRIRDLCLVENPFLQTRGRHPR